jgi:4-hydroxybenzoate polyprenyltransferase
MWNILEQIQKALHNLWLLTKDDTPTFVIPNTIFGICGALAHSQLLTHSNSPTTVLHRLPHILLFNYTNLLIFDLSNQRLPASVQEDTLNKPWRPIPSARLTTTQLRQTLLLAIPPVLLLNHLLLHVFPETACIHILTWMYNDLHGGNENWLTRNILIAAAFAYYNLGSLKVAAGAIATNPAVEITPQGYMWIGTISAVILTTMQVQDLKDTVGDQARGRRTAPLVLGDRPTRWSIAVPIPLWTAYCAYFWGLGWWAVAPVLLGVYTALRCVRAGGREADRRTWECWCLWTVGLYLMPLVR